MLRLAHSPELIRRRPAFENQGLYFFRLVRRKKYLLIKEKKIKKLFIFVFIVLFIQTFCQAESIVFKSGKAGYFPLIERTDTFIVLDVNGMPVRYDLNEIESIDGMPIRQSDDIIFEVILIIIVSVIYFYFLFVAEAFPGVGWFSFSVRTVSLKTRALSFIIFLAGVSIRFATGVRLIEYICGIIAVGLLAFSGDENE